MHGNSDPLEVIFTRFQTFKSHLQGLVDKAATEIAKPTRRNATMLEANNAAIEAHCRTFPAFLSAMNTARIGEEEGADDRNALFAVRQRWGVMTARVNLVRTDLNRWPEIRDLVSAQRKIVRRKLYPNDPGIHSTEHHQSLTSDAVLRGLHVLINPEEQSAVAIERASFPDIGLANSEFHMHMHAAYRTQLAKGAEGTIRFLDVGCGAGLKVHAALRYFDEAYGFDLDPAYIAAGSRFFDFDVEKGFAVGVQDALTYDGYGQFDVIYLYRPIDDDTLIVDLERRIADKASPGTTLVAPYVGFSHRASNYGCGHVAGAVYLAGTSQAAADRLRRKAEKTGPFILKPTQQVLSSVWDPIVAASRANGYDFPRLYRQPRY